MPSLLSRTASALAAILVVSMSFTAILTVPAPSTAAHAAAPILA